MILLAVDSKMFGSVYVIFIDAILGSHSKHKSKKFPLFLNAKSKIKTYIRYNRVGK